MMKTRGLKSFAAGLSALALAGGMALAGAGTAAAQYPERPVTLLVAWGAGGGTDTVARMFAAQLEKELGQPINVVNQTGGGGVVGHSAMANADPDGYTLGIASMEVTVYESMGLADIGPDSYTPIMRLAAIPAGITVKADAPYQSAEELLAAIKEQPKGTFKSSGCGIGCAWHFAVTGWMKSEGLPPDQVLWIPSQGGAPALQDLVAGGLEMVTASVVESRSLLEAGEIRALAVMNDARQDAFSDVPTLEEATGADWSMSTWFGLVGPKGLPEEVSQALVEASQKVFDSEAFQGFMAERGYVAIGETPDAFQAFMAQQSESLAGLIDELGLAQ